LTFNKNYAAFVFISTSVIDYDHHCDLSQGAFSYM